MDIDCDNINWVRNIQSLFPPIILPVIFCLKAHLQSNVRGEFLNCLLPHKEMRYI